MAPQSSATEAVARFPGVASVRNQIGRAALMSTTNEDSRRRELSRTRYPGAPLCRGLHDARSRLCGLNRADWRVSVEYLSPLPFSLFQLAVLFFVDTRTGD